MIWAIREQRAFDDLVRRGSRVRTATLWCTYLPDRSTANPPRVAFAIGRTLGSAVIRNTLRRRLRAIVGHLDLAPGWWLFGATPNVREHTFVSLQAEVDELVRLATRSAPSP